jgi:molybdenum cofactor guanylyltransferase
VGPARLVTVPYDAVVLAGGTARRLGGLDKPAALVGGRTLLDRVLAALLPAAEVVVVGPERATVRPVRWVREDPPGGGPVPALAAGLPLVGAARVAVLAADLPFLDRTVLDRLAAAAEGHDGALLVDDDGRDQLLCGVWSTAALRTAVAAADGPRLSALLRALDAVRVPADAAPGRPAPWFDCDTADDLDTARRLEHP